MDGSDLDTSYDGMSKTKSHKKNTKSYKKIVVITCYVMLYTDIDFNEWRFGEDRGMNTLSWRPSATAFAEGIWKKLL